MAPKPNNALVVRTFAYPTSVAGNGPDDDGTRPLAGAQVTIAQGPAPLPAAQTADSDGRVSFPDIAAGGNYRIAVAPPPGYQAPPANGVFLGGRRQTFGTNIRVRNGGEVVVEVGLAPRAGRVAGTIVVPTVADPSGIRVEARARGRLVDSAVTAVGANGAFRLTIDEPGLIEIRPDPSFTDPAGRTYVPQPGDANQFVVVPPNVPPEPPVPVTVDYVATRAQVTVGAQVLEEVGGQRERRPLDGVTFQLFAQGQPAPLRELTTQPGLTTVFADLPAGSYRVVAVAPPASNGHRLQLTRPSTPELALRIGDGQRIDLSQEFEFEPTRGSVIGSVVVSRDNTPVPGVAVVISSEQEPQDLRRTVTDADGEYQVDDLLPGRYRVALEQRVVTALGREWEQEQQNGRDASGRTVEVRARATVFVPEFRLVEEQHVIFGRVVGPDGRGAPFVTVQVFDTADPAGLPIANVLTDRDGGYEYRAPSAGTFYIRIHELNGVAPQLTPVTVNSPTTAPTLATSTRFDGFGGGAPPPTPAPVVQDNDFPFLTQEIESDGRTGAAQQYGGAGGPVGRIVERELREVLGWRPRTGDPKGFQAALQQAFTVAEVAGHTEVTWNPRSYSVEIQADLGAITGAQASLYTRAKGALEAVVPLLDGLTPLRVDFDEENVAAIRAIVRSQLSELVAELGMEGGPRVQRVDQLFTFLLGSAPTDALGRTDRVAQRDPDNVDGTFGILRDRLGLDRDRINTIDEEQGFTNFLVVLDHVVSLAESWDAQRVFFVRGSEVEPFLGTQLVLLSRDLEVIAESVHEVEFAMDSVFLGAAERQTLELRFPADPRRPLISGSPPMFVSELLGWVEHFAAEEGRQLIDEGGREGVVAFRPTILLLQALVEAALVAPVGAQDPTRMPAAYRRQRVQRALAELTQQLGNAAERVARIRPPTEQPVVAAVRPAAPAAVTGRPPARPRLRPPPVDDDLRPGVPVID